MQKDFDYSTYSLSQLLEIQDQLPKVIAKRQVSEVVAARREIQQIADRLGLSLDVLLTEPISGTKGTRPARYADPRDPSRTWSGQGHAPYWVRELEAEGTTREDMRIKDAGEK